MVGTENDNHPGHEQQAGKQQVERQVHMHEQKREVAEQLVPAVEYLDCQADNYEHQEQHERFDATGPGVGEDQHEQHQRDE